MTTKKIHPSVEKFKAFVKDKPELIKAVRTGKHTWQELYEDWYLLGEEDTIWDAYQSGEGKHQKPDDAQEKPGEKQADWMTSVMGSLKNMDVNQMQGYIHNMSQALAAIQGVIGSFQGGGQGAPPKGTASKPPPNPFSFRKD